MTPFAVRIAVETPIALRNLLHLDALLGNVATRLGHAYDDLPLKRVDGLWHASAALLESTILGISEESYKRIKAIDPLAIPEGIFDGLRAGKPSIRPMSPYRDQITEVPLMRGVIALWFAGQGDTEAVMELLREVQTLGKMGSAGYGRVTGVELFRSTHENAGITLVGGLPARTIPVRLWEALGLQKSPKALISEQRWYGPYWNSPPEACLCPMQVDLIGTRHEIKTLLAVQ